jgi:hypothetical protein
MSTAGNTTLSVTFTPSDTIDYNAASASVTLTVTTPTKTTPTITWSTPAPITYGTALSSVQLDATASVAGSFTYLPAAGAVLNAGTQVLTANFTPTDTTDYNSASASVTLTVNKATPVITWPAPASITAGTALSSTQLNATASVAGTFVYSPPAGTVMSTAGNATLSVTFTPTDTDYNTATASVTLTVNPPTRTTPTITVTPSAPSITTTQSLSVAVIVSGGNGNPTPTGTVTLTGGGYTSPATALSGGAATISVQAGLLDLGSDTLNLSYNPDSSSSSTYNSATGSTRVSVTQAASPTFALSNSGSITLTRGTTTGNTSVLTITPAGGFTGTVSLSCSITPSVSVPPTCAVPASVTITSNGAATATLTVTTAAAAGTTALANPDKPSLLPAGVLAFTLMCFLGIPVRRRYARALFSVLFIGIVAAAIGCGGGSSSSGGGGGGGGGSAGTSTGTYTVTVTGISGSLTATTPVSLTVN